MSSLELVEASLCALRSLPLPPSLVAVAVTLGEELAKGGVRDGVLAVAHSDPHGSIVTLHRCGPTSTGRARVSIRPRWSRHARAIAPSSP